MGVPESSGILSELVETRELGEEIKGSAGCRDVLDCLKSQGVLHIVVGLIDKVSGLRALEKSQRTVEASGCSIHVERRKTAGLIRPPLPVRRHEFRLGRESLHGTGAGNFHHFVQGHFLGPQCRTEAARQQQGQTTLYLKGTHVSSIQQICVKCYFILPTIPIM